MSVSCRDTGKADVHPVPTTVTVIFKDAPAQSGTTRLGGNLHTLPEGTLIYVDSALNRVYYTPRNIGQDTLTVAAPFGYAEIIHRNQAIENLHYLLQAGDTVLFTYGENLRPQMQSLVSDQNTWLYNLQYKDPRAVQRVGYSTQIILNDAYYQMADEILNRPKQKYSTERLNKCKKYYLSLDSLRPIYDAYLHDFRVLLDSLETSGALPVVYADYYRRQLAESKPTELPTDSMMHYISHYNRAIAHQYRVAPNNAKSPQRFDLIAADTSLSPTVQKAILHDIMSLIECGDYWRPYPAGVVRKYRDKYQKITGDSVFRIRIVDKDNLITDGYSSDLVLQDLDGKQLTYGDILDRHNGKVIYVDLWASWCAPCRAGMPDAKRLREEYKGKNVVFLYLAINDTDDAWRGAVRSCETDYLGENYRILNAAESQFLKQIKHTHIPHLLLYDRTGKLVDLDAPRPESEQIRVLLNKHL